MKHLKTIVLIIMVCYLSVACSPTERFKSPGERNYFQFSIANYHTKRQSGQVVNVYVKYAYKKDLASTNYPDYRILRTALLKYLEPSAEFPADIYWEILATKIGQELMHDFPIDAISVQLYVLDNPEGNEPGDHGPTFTIGNITPLDVHP